MHASSIPSPGLAGSKDICILNAAVFAKLLSKEITTIRDYP